MIFFLENEIRQAGQCISGQTLRKAAKNIPRAIKYIRNEVIINLGSVDLVQGRELIDMINDTFQLYSILHNKNIFPIFTTIPPLANHMHYKELESKRKSYNIFLMKHFDYIDIESCFVTNYNRILFAAYQR